MRYLIAVLIVAAFVAVPLVESATDPATLRTPVMRSVEPSKAKTGTVVTVTGEYLDQRISEVYLSDGKENLKVDVVKKTAAELQFRVPGNAKPGKYRIVVLILEPEPTLLEEPVVLFVE